MATWNEIKEAADLINEFVEAVDQCEKPDSGAGDDMAERLRCWLAKHESEAVFDEDGKEFKVGDEVWSTVPGTHDCAMVTLVGNGRIDIIWPDGSEDDGLFPFEFTHKEPDTKEKINDDALLSTEKYWRCFECTNCKDCPSRVSGKRPYERYEVNSCRTAQILDLLKRQQELDAREVQNA